MRSAKSKWKGELKECSGNGSCGKFLSVDNFNSKGSGHYRAQCKSCWNKWRRRDAKTENGKAKQKKHINTYYKKHPHKLIEKKERSEALRLITLRKRLIKRINLVVEDKNKTKAKTKANEDRLQGIRDRVKEFGYNILSEFSSQQDNPIVRCESGHERKAKLHNILIGRAGCPECRIDKGQRRIELSAKKLGAKILSKYESKYKKVLYRCSNGHETMRYPSMIWNGHHCGECENGSNSYSFYHNDEDRQNREGYFYEFYFNKDGKAYKMIGIATVWKARLYQYRGAGIEPFDISLTKMSMYEAFVCEQEILHRKELQDLKPSGLGFAGSTECFNISDIDLFHPVHSI